VPTWGFLTKHAQVLLCIARDPGVRLRDIAVSVDITERSAFGIVSDLVAAGYIVKEKGGRRNRYRVEAHLPVPESADRRLAIGDLLALLGGPGGEQPDSGKLLLVFPCQHRLWLWR
jgi:Winged helix DNA-binding domain